MVDDDDNDDDNTFLSKCYQTPKITVYINCLQFLHTLISKYFILFSHATLQGAVTWRNHCHDHATLQGVIILSAILKIAFRHILFYFLFFLMQFGP